LVIVLPINDERFDFFGSFKLARAEQRDGDGQATNDSGNA
jgi:hypothetical protein